MMHLALWTLQATKVRLHLEDEEGTSAHDGQSDGHGWQKQRPLCPSFILAGYVYNMYTYIIYRISEFIDCVRKRT
jgi:hypothetical protein